MRFNPAHLPSSEQRAAGMNDRSPSSSDASRESKTRPVWPIFWLALLVALAVVGLWLGLALRRARSAYPGLSPNVPLAADKSYGVNADLTHYPPADLDRALTEMHNLGLRWIRQPFPWAGIEPAPDQFNWTPWDRVMEAASAHDLRVIAVLDTTPAWARPPGTSPFTPPTELADFGGFAHALAARYGQRLDFYQIWDEPNLSAHWGDQFVDPTAYARLLREGAFSVRAADAESSILTAALAPTLETGPLNLNEPDFLAGLYAANAASWFDVVAIQPYGFGQEPSARPNPNELNFARAELVRATMAAHGDAHKPLWATAFGWSALPESWSGRPSPWPSLAPDRQAAYTTAAIRQARASWPWLGPMLFAAWDAEALTADDPRRGLALFSSGQAQALLDLDRSYVNYPLLEAEIATVGSYPADHASGHYTGDWRFSPAGADVPRHPPAELVIPFEGTRLDLVVRRGTFRGFFYVSVDGQPASHLPRQNGRAYLTLYDPLEEGATVTLARYLPDGPHTAQIEAEGGWYQWPLVGWRVSREADTRASRSGLVLVAGLGALAVIGLAKSVPRHDLWAVPDWGETLTVRYMGLGTPVHLTILAAVALAFYLAPGTLASLGLSGLLFLAILPRPDLGLALVAFSLPFFLLPKPLVGRTISMTEVSLVLVALAHVVRRAFTLIGKSTNQQVTKSANQPPASSLQHPALLDWSASILTGVAALAAALTIVPAANTGPLAVIDWPVWALMLLPLAGVLAALAGASGTPGQLGTAPTRGLDLAVAALVLLALAATLAAHNFGVSMQEFHVVVWDGAAFYAFLRLTRCPRARRDRFEENLPGPPLRDAQRLGWLVVDAFLSGTTLMALYAIYQFFFTDQAITAEGVHRALGAYGSPNNLALLLDRAASILIAVLVTAYPALFRPAGAAGTGASVSRPIRHRRIPYAVALMPILIALLLTFSRGALLLGLPAALLFIGVMRGGRALLIALGTLAVAGIGLLPFLGTDRFRSMLDLRGGTGFFRLRLWQSSWAMLRDHPWLGVGLDNFLYQYRTRYILPDAWQEPNLSHPHNVLLDFGTRLGMGGVAVLLWLQIAFWRLAWRLYSRQARGEGQALTLGLMASMVAALAHGLVDNSFFLVDLAFIFFMILGIIGKLADSTELYTVKNHH